MAIVPTARLVPGKLEPIAVDDSAIVRQRVVDLLSPPRPVTLVSAMPGWGKSVAVRHWVDRVDRPVAWVNVDSLDTEPDLFWTHTLAALMLACPQVDEEPMMLLRERTFADPTFLAALINRLHGAATPPVVVLDGQLDQVSEPVIVGLTRLVERAHGVLDLVVVSPVDPSLPIGRWRHRGWVRDVRGSDLRFTDDEAVELARHIGLDDVDEAAVVALNRRVDGWPLALRLGLGNDVALTFDDDRPGDWPDAERGMSAHLGAQVVAMLDEHDLDVALDLSVLEELDPAMCRELVGERARGAIRSLLRHDMLLTVVDHRTGTMRFHPLIRRLLELELGWRDPVRRVELHRTAAAAFEAAGDLRSAFRHLHAIGETESARALLVDAAVDQVDRGDLTTLHTLTAQLPSVTQVDRIELALDLGLIAAWGDGTAAARRWWRRADDLANELPPGTVGSSTIALRLRQLACMISLLEADLEQAVALVETLPRPAAPPSTDLDTHMALVATRALIAARHPSAGDWVDRIGSFTGPPIVTNVTIPALRAWQLWVDGDLPEAERLSEAVIAWLEDHHVDVHHWAIDSLITAGWCRLSRGDLTEAADLARRAELVASFIPCTWNRAQAAYLSGTVALARGNAAAAMQIALDTRADVPGTTSGYAGRLVYLAAEAALSLRRFDVATELVAELPDGPGRALLRARLAPMSDAQLQEVFAERSTWAEMHRLRAGAILATRSSAPAGLLADVVTQCATSGWVSPLLGLGPRAERSLRALPLERLHPALLAALDAAGGGTAVSVRSAPRLTPRELSLLELLPTHLSYAEMAKRMYLSVNTVKASLKGLYRKLGAHTRAEAVAAGQQHGYI